MLAFNVTQCRSPCRWSVLQWSSPPNSRPASIAFPTNTVGNLSTTIRSAGYYQISISVEDGLACIATQDIAVQATCPGLLEITPSVPAAATAATPYTQEYTLSSSAILPVVWTCNPPSGLVLLQNGLSAVLSGSIDTPGEYTFQISATDYLGCNSATYINSLSVLPAPPTTAPFPTAAPTTAPSGTTYTGAPTSTSSTTSTSTLTPSGTSTATSTGKTTQPATTTPCPSYPDSTGSSSSPHVYLKLEITGCLQPAQRQDLLRLLESLGHLCSFILFEWRYDAPSCQKRQQSNTTATTLYIGSHAASDAQNVLQKAGTASTTQTTFPVASQAVEGGKKGGTALWIIIVAAVAGVLVVVTGVIVVIVVVVIHKRNSSSSSHQYELMLK